MKQSIILLSVLLLAGFSACKKDKKDTTPPSTTPPVTMDTSNLTGYAIDGLKDFTLTNYDENMPIVVKKTGTAQTNLSISVGDLPKGVSADIETKSGIPDFSSAITFRIDELPPAKVYSIKVVLSDGANNKKTYRLNMKIDSFKYNLVVKKSKLRVYKNASIRAEYDVAYLSATEGVLTTSLSGLPAGASVVMDKPYPGYFEINSGSAALGTYSLKLKAACISAGSSQEAGFQLLVTDSCFRPLIKNYSNNTYSEDGATPTTFSLYGISEVSGEANAISFYSGSSYIPYFQFYVNCDGTIEVTDQASSGFKTINGTGTYTTSPASITLNCVGETWSGVKKTLKYTFNL